MTGYNKLTILVAPLDWGLGHATRCIPIIAHLQHLGCKVIIATEGLQENLLKNEFPGVVYVKLPGYRIRYSKSKRFFALKIVMQLGKIYKAVRAEHQWLRHFVTNNSVHGIVSDNRYGFYHAAIPSIIITHQLKILARFAFVERVMQFISYKYLERFNHCWVPDQPGICNLAGKLAHPQKMPEVAVTYIGSLSRLQPVVYPIKYDAVVILSGPEPGRSIFETLVLSQLKSTTHRLCIIRGLPGVQQTLPDMPNVHIYNHCNAVLLQQIMQESRFVISRSGYTTVMDVCRLQKKAILVPTPGQTEQTYLGQHLHNQKWCMLLQQANFHINIALQMAEEFEFCLPDLQMEQYKTAVETWVASLAKQY